MSFEETYYKPQYPQGNISTTPIGDLFDQSTKALSGRWTNGVIGTLITTIIGAVAGLIPFVGNIAGLVLGAAFSLGWAVWSLNLLRRGQERLDDIFSGFQNFGNALAVGLLSALIICIPFLIILIPMLVIYSGAILSGSFDMNDIFSASDTWLFIGGAILALIIMPIVVYLSLTLGLSFFILADHPQMATTQILRQSQHLMEGNKGKLLLIGLMYCALAVVAMIPCGLGLLFLGPHARTTLAGFYLDIVGKETTAFKSSEHDDLLDQ